MGFEFNKKVSSLQSVEERMVQASQQGPGFCQTVISVDAHWQRYKEAESDATELIANSLQFSADAKAMTADVVPKFAEAFAIIAGGSLSVDGDVNSDRLTVRDLCEQIVASAIEQGLMAPEV